jgi:tRNA-2-methylthio-N6-dimethylallyladenosine synthase
MKQVHISTFGCQMNDRDSELIAQVLSAHDYRLTERPEEADLILINTCSIRQKAEEKTYSLLGRLKRLKSRNPGLIIGVGGCVAQQEGDRLLERVPHLDLVFGTRWINELPDLVQTVRQRGRRMAEVALDHPLRYLPSEKAFRPSPIKASVTIMHGCNNYCAYCVVPYVRGPEWSRPPEDIAAEVRRLAAQGVKEVLLLGQNVNSYGAPEEGGGRAGALAFHHLPPQRPLAGSDRLFRPLVQVVRTYSPAFSGRRRYGPGPHEPWVYAGHVYGTHSGPAGELPGDRGHLRRHGGLPRGKPG